VPYTLNDSPNGTVLTLTAATRDELVHALLGGLLEASYRNPSPSGAPEGQFVPIQASGNDTGELLTNLAADALRAIAETDGTLVPPRWLSFDEKRVTAHLPVVPAGASRRAFVLAARHPALTVESDLPAFRARLELAAAERAA